MTFLLNVSFAIPRVVDRTSDAEPRQRHENEKSERKQRPPHERKRHRGHPDESAQRFEKVLQFTSILQTESPITR